MIKINHKLKLSIKNKFIAGVCGGIGEYFNIDPTLIRVIFVLSCFIFYFSPILIYLIFWLVLPKDKSAQDNTHTNLKSSIFDEFNEDK